MFAALVVVLSYNNIITRLLILSMCYCNVIGMTTEYPLGTKFYKKKGMKAVTVHLSKEYHEKLLELAKKEERSLQKTARRILENGLK